MDKVHPLTEAVARILAAQSPNATYGELADAAIRAVLTFEPTYGMLLAVLHSDKWTDANSSPEQRMDPVDAWEAMTAALLKEIDDVK